MKTSVLEFTVNDTHRRYSSSSSKGDQIKWYQDGMWLKANDRGYEGVAEWTVSRLLEHSNLDRSLYLPYHLAKIDDDIKTYSGCASPNFLKPGDSLVTLHRMLVSNGLDIEDLFGSSGVAGRIHSTVAFMEEITGLSLSEYMANILALDMIVLNEDRHTNNIAVVYNEQTGFRLAPFFDHGLSLLSDASDYPEMYPTRDNIVKVRSLPFDRDFRRQASVLQPSLLFDFKFASQLVDELQSIQPRAAEALAIQMERHHSFFKEEL